MTRSTSNLWRGRMATGIRLRNIRLLLRRAEPLNSRLRIIHRRAKENHPHLSAIIESTFAARRAGIQQASNATQASNKEIASKVKGSVTSTSYIQHDSHFVSQYA